MPHPRSRVRSGFTMIEMAIVIGVVAILAAITLPNVDFSRWRMDSNMRAVQNQLIGAQMLSVQKKVRVILTFVYNEGQFRVVQDQNNDGLWGGSEPRNWRTLAEKMKIVTPPTTIDGASPYYATGPGIRYVGITGTSGLACNSCPTMDIDPTGSTSGDVVVYFGSGKSASKADYRAVQIYGSTSKVKLWRMQDDGTWKQDADN